MESGVTVALITSAVAVMVALVSGWFSRRNAREIERLHATHEQTERLGGATGALRLQLFLSTRSLVQRLRQYHSDSPSRPFRLRAARNGSEREYHACGLLIFRIMRPLAVSYIIEQATFYRDLLLEPTMVDLLRFNHAAFEMLTGEKLGEEVKEGREVRIPPFPHFEMEQCYDLMDRWPPTDAHADVRPFQRVRASYLRMAAAKLTVGPDEREPQRRCMTHDEFLERWERPDEHVEFHEKLQPVKATLDDFWPMNNPVLWLRLVGYAYVCRWFYARVCDDALNKKVGVAYTPVVLPVAEMLRSAALKAAGPPAAEPAVARHAVFDAPIVEGREHLTRNADAYQKRFEKLIAEAL